MKNSFLENGYFKKWIFSDSEYFQKVDIFRSRIISESGYLQKVDSFKKWAFPKNINFSKISVKSGYFEKWIFKKI